MRRTEKNLLLLTALFVSALVTSNMVSGKLVDFGIATIPGGVVCYVPTFLFSDVVGEVWGEEQANRLVKIGFASQCFASVLVLLAQILPAKDASVQSAYELLLGKSLWFTVAGLLAYVLSQSVDVVIFHRLKAKQKSRKWLRNNLSTMVSQGIDTLVFLGVSFGLGSGWLWNGQIGALGSMIVAQYLVKTLFALFDTPIFYFLTRHDNQQRRKRYGNMEHAEEQLWSGRPGDTLDL